MIFNLKMFRTKENNLRICMALIVFNLFVATEQHEKNPDLIYILQWTSIKREPFVFWKPKRKYFKAMNCEHQNCYITNDSNYFYDVTDFDVILFNAIDIRGNMELPLLRSDNQIYVLLSQESAANFPIFKNFDWFFNYTWTYKLDSDIFYPYFIVRNKFGEIVAPKRNVHWMDVKKMKPTSQSIIDRLQNKKTAAAWFVSNCYANNERLNYVHNLREALSGYNLEVDIYGVCGDLFCPRDTPDDCLGKVESDYYFYLSLENSFSADYVTEKLLTALNHFAVPVVFAVGNFTRFAPMGIYLDGKALGEEGLAKKMNEAIQDKQKYYDYFKWHEYYTYQDTTESGEIDPLCAFCDFLNNMTVRGHRRVYAHLFEWWNEFETTRNDSIFWYAPALYPRSKSYFMTRPNTKVVEPPSVLQSVSQFVDQLWNHFFE